MRRAAAENNPRGTCPRRGRCTAERGIPPDQSRFALAPVGIILDTGQAACPVQWPQPRTQSLEETVDRQTEKRSGWSWWYLLFLIQFVVSLWVPFYNKMDPSWIGIPFFYWYQMLWVIVGAILTAIVYFATDA